MTQLGLEITDRFGQRQSHDGRGKAQAQGENLAILAAQALRSLTAKKWRINMLPCQPRPFIPRLVGR